MNFFEKCIYGAGRKFSIEDVISIKGKVIEEEDKFICYVDARTIGEEIDKHLEIYNLKLKGFYTLDKKFKEMFDYYKLDKPVYYILIILILILR